jgi:hypothetical protein
VSTSLLQWLGGGLLSVLLVAAVTVGSWAALRTGKTAQTIKDWRESAESAQSLAESLRGQLDDMRQQHDREVNVLRQQLAANDERMHGQDLVIAELRQLITGAAALDRLLEQQTALRAEVLSEFKLTRQLITGAGGPS